MIRQIIDNFDYDYPMQGEGPFYTDFLINISDEYGISKCDWEESKYPNLAEHKESLIAKFDWTYKYYEIGHETPFIWQHYLQDRLDAIKEKYNHNFKVYSINNVDEMGKGFTETFKYNRDNVHDGHSGSTFVRTDDNSRTTTETGENTETNNNTSKYKDTPISGTINNPTSQVEDNSSNSINETRSSTDTNKQTINDAKNDTDGSTNNEQYDSERKNIRHDDHVIDEVNDLTKKYKIIENDFLDEFKDLFMQLQFMELVMN